MERELEKYKKPDGTIDWEKWGQDRLAEQSEPNKLKRSYWSNKPDETNKKLGGYRNLIVYQQAVMIYDLTMEFCNRFLDITRDKRTIEQMIQAGRSGKQNIVEGSLEKSQKMNINLISVSRASFGELLEDYHDFLRTRDLPLWHKDDPRVMEIRGYRINLSNGANMSNWSNGSNLSNLCKWTNTSERFANLMATLISKENYLLDKMLRALEEKFIREGGYSEQLRRKREQEKKRRFSSW